MAETDTQRLPYRLREPFLSSTEQALFRLLNKLMGERYLICPKVSLNDVFYIVRPNENVHFFSKLFRKHVDFLLCDRQKERARRMGTAGRRTAEKIFSNSEIRKRYRDIYLGQESLSYVDKKGA